MVLPNCFYFLFCKVIFLNWYQTAFIHHKPKIIFCLESAQLAAKEKGYNKHFAFLLSDGLKTGRPSETFLFQG